MERLTEKDNFFDYVLPEQNIFGDNQAFEISLGKTEYLCQSYIAGEAIKRFGELEDVLEKYNIENLDEFIKEYSSRNIKLANDNYALEQELAESESKRKSLEEKLDEAQKPKEIRFNGFVVDCNYDEARKVLQEDILKMYEENKKLKESEELSNYAKCILKNKKLEEDLELSEKCCVEYEQEIQELKQQLVESEKQIKDAGEAGNMAVDSWCKNRRKYEAQIAEMQNKSFILYSMLYETLEKQGCENVASQIDQMTGWTYDKEADWLKGNRNYDQLKQQLAGKDREIADLQHRLEISEIAVESAVEIANIKSNHFWTVEELKEKAEKELKEKNNGRTV